MKIILATGIYPPDIGGPATYVQNLAGELSKKGHEVVVVTYGDKSQITNHKFQKQGTQIEYVSSSLPLLRWWWYAQKLKEVGADVDVVYAFSSVSCGIPVILSGLSKPKKMLRLGGDFFWERYTDAGGKLGLRQWYQSGHLSFAIGHFIMRWILRCFDHIVFSTDFQKDIYKNAYKRLPSYSVIENALSIERLVPKEQHTAKTPFRLLFLGRFVPFKNIPSLIEALAQIPDAYLTLVGEGPQDDRLRTLAEHHGLTSRMQFVSPLHGKDKFDVFMKHDLLVLPSFTDISPNTALEAKSVGLPTLLTKEHGLSAALLEGIVVDDLSTPAKISAAIARVREGYSLVSEAAHKDSIERSFETVADETLSLFSSTL